MWRQTKLLGRDSVLSLKIRPRLREKIGFVITGQHGIGKTALLEWAFDQAKGKKAFVSATWTVKEIMVKICDQWGLEVKNDTDEKVPRSRWQVAWMERAILAESGHWIFVDDLHVVTPAVLRRLKILRDRCLIVGAGVPPFKREELRRLLWGLPDIALKPLQKKDLKRIAVAAAPLIQTHTPLEDAIHASRGIPGQLMHALKGEVTPETTKVKGEEIDISPVLILVLVCVMATRYIAIGLESTSLYVLGGVGMAAGLFFRFFLYKGIK
jgi:adenylate kinase